MVRHLGTLVGVVVFSWAGAAVGQQQQQQPGGGPSVPVARQPVQQPGLGGTSPGSASHGGTGVSANVQLPPTGQHVVGSSVGRAQAVANDPGIWDEKNWMCWWETNRDAVLGQMWRRKQALAGQQPPAPADAKPPEQRERAVKALVQATQAARPNVRAAAAVSLGQMRQEDALKRLVEMAAKDPDDRVRGMAWLAVGLVGNADAQKALPAAKPQSEFEQLGVLAGIGMLDRPGEPAFQYVRGLVAKPPTPEVGRMAVWALRVHRRAADHDLIRSTLSQTPPAPAPILSEGLLALGAIGDPRDAEFLADVATDGRAAEVPDQVVVSSGGAYPTNRRTFRVPHEGQSTGVRQAGPVTNNPGARLDAMRGSYPRVSASLALGMGPENGKAIASGSVLARNALLRNFSAFLDQGGPAYSGASIVSFALATAERDAYLLRNVLDMGTDPFIGLVNPKSPMRGFAALGLGLYMAGGGPSRIATRPIGGVATPGFDLNLPDYLDINETLAQRYNNVQESPDLRAACALALGLSGDPANVRRLLEGANKIGRNDQLLLGYTTLALGLLGEKSAMNAAGPMLGAAAGKIDVEAVATRGVAQPGAPAARGAAAAAATTAPAWEEVRVPQGGPALMAAFGRRAALAGVAMLGDPKSEAMFAGAWARDGATVQDVARVIGWTKAYRLADPLSELVARDKKGAAEAAMSLGWVFDTDRPSRLSRLVTGNNYHQPQADYAPGVPASPVMLRDYPRVADLLLYSTPVGGRSNTELPPRRRQ
jgi:hypothetical protein